jgi:uncharacterized damage-inducible protein DinB
MTNSTKLAERFREVYLSGQWVTGTNFKAQLSDINWEQATRKTGNLNTIAQLTFHIHYYIAGVLQVFRGGPLEIRDKYSFDMEPVASEQDWQNLLARLLTDAEEFAQAIEQMSDAKLAEGFVKPEYGDFQRNIDVIIEHGYYHLGQVVLIRKMMAV